jgi:hypothetical protein
MRKALIVFCPWAHRTVRCTTRQWTVRDSLPCLVKPIVASLWSHGTLGSPVADRTVRCSLVIVGRAHMAPVDHAIDRWLGAWLAHRIVWWIIVVMPFYFPESDLFTGCSSLAPDTVRCTPYSPVHRRLVQVWLDLAKLLHWNFSQFEKFPST